MFECLETSTHLLDKIKYVSTELQREIYGAVRAAGIVSEDTFTKVYKDLHFKLFDLLNWHHPTEYKS